MQAANIDIHFNTMHQNIKLILLSMYRPIILFCMFAKGIIFFIQHLENSLSIFFQDFKRVLLDIILLALLSNRL